MPSYCLKERLEETGYDATCGCPYCLTRRKAKGVPDYTKSLYPPDDHQVDDTVQSDLGRLGDPIAWPENNTPDGLLSLAEAEAAIAEAAGMDDGSVRTFAGGATRDTTVDKHDFAGFLSVMVLRRFGEYMHKHRKQSDGQLRDSDNWKKGMPRRVFAESLLRHALDVVGYITDDDDRVISQDDLEEALMALIFNAQGLAREVLKGRSVE